MTTRAEKQARLETLSRAGLPANYDTLSSAQRRKRRMNVLTGFFDPAKPKDLITDTQAYLRAHYLWVEFYLKPSFPDVYFRRDHLLKYDRLLNVTMGDPLVETEPTKSIVTATRQTMKTTTLIVEAMSFFLCVRPNTKCLVAESNDNLSCEQIGKIMRVIEDSDLIAEDFGGRGSLFKLRNNRFPWNMSHLHSPLTNSQVQAVSIESAQRGRGFDFLVIDDPESEDTSMSKPWRIRYFDKLFGTFVPMVQPGGHIIWIGTPIHGGSALSLAMFGQSETSETADTASVDSRFLDWHRISVPDIEERDGQYITLNPDKISVEAFERKLALDPISARKEILCLPVTPGFKLFAMEPFRHEFLHAMSPDNTEVFIDLNTKTIKPWSEFLSSLYIVGAGDPADGQSQDADPGALVWIGVDPQGILYVLDAVNKRCFTEDLIDMAYSICCSMKCQEFGWERSSIALTMRVAQQIRENYEKQGYAMPAFRELETHGKSKPLRMMTLVGHFTHSRVRFLTFDDVEVNGTFYRSVEFPRLGAYRELLAQLRDYTDQGLRTHDDLSDAFEMACRLAERRRGTLLELTPQDPFELSRKGWEEIGLIPNPPPGYTPPGESSEERLADLLDVSEPKSINEWFASCPL